MYSTFCGRTLIKGASIQIRRFESDVYSSMRFTIYGASNGEQIYMAPLSISQKNVLNDVVCDAQGYRFGFNGQERDDEVSGSGNSNTAEFWQYDTRLGRRWNVDPVVKCWESPYATFANNPIWLMDPTGADTIVNPNGDKWNVGDGYSTQQIGDEHFLVGEGLKTKIWDPSANDGEGMYVEYNGPTASKEDIFSRTNSLMFWVNTVPGGAYSVVEYYNVNEYGWRAANGQWNSINLLEKGSNGKYVRGVQGYRNGLGHAKISVANIKAVGGKIYIIGQLYNGVKLVYHVSEGNISAASKDGLDMTMAYVMYAGGVPGLVVGGVYFALDYVGVFTPNNKEVPSIMRQFGEPDAMGVTLPLMLNLE